MTSAPSNFDITQTLPLSKITRPVGAPKNRFNQFNLDYARTLTDDYVHGKLLTLKYAGKGDYFTLNGKGTLDFKYDAVKRDQVPVTSSEVKVITNIQGRNLETRFDNKGGIRFWGNFGTYTIGRPMIVTAKVKTNSAFNRLSGNLGLEYQGTNMNIWTRLDLKNDNTLLFNEKMIFRIDKAQIGWAAKLNLFTPSMTRYNLFVSYYDQGLGLIAEHVSKNKTKFEMGKLNLAATYTRAGNDYIAKLSYQPHKVQQIAFKVGAVANIDRNTAFRAKINNKSKLSLALRYRFNSNLSVVAGTQANLLDPTGDSTSHKFLPIPVGLNLEFNYF